MAKKLPSPIVIQPASDVPGEMLETLQRRIDDVVAEWEDDYGYSTIDTPPEYAAAPAMVAALEHLITVHGGTKHLMQSVEHKAKAAYAKAKGTS